MKHNFLLHSLKMQTHDHINHICHGERWAGRDTDSHLSFQRLPLEEARHCRAATSGDGAEGWLLACRWVVPTGRHTGLARGQETVPCLSSCQGKCCCIVAAADEKVRERMRLFRLQLPRTQLVRRNKASHCSGRKVALCPNSFHVICQPATLCTR